MAWQACFAFLLLELLDRCLRKSEIVGGPLGNFQFVNDARAERPSCLHLRLVTALCQRLHADLVELIQQLLADFLLVGTLHADVSGVLL